MTGAERVNQYLSEAKTYYLATVDNDQPRVRPFGTSLLFEGKVYIQTGLKKDVAHQIEKNPKFEICACKGADWLRVSGELVYDERIEPQEAMLEAYPSLKNMYTPGDGNTAVYYIKNATATFSSFTAAPETINF